VRPKLAVAALCVALGLVAHAEAPEAEAAPSTTAPAAAEPEATLREGPILVARVEGTINPASTDFLISAIDEAERVSASLLLIELDTPGGILKSTQQIVQAMLAADVPIAVFVSPRGAWAASAGTFLTMAAHVAAMAPGSSIGAAHPVNPYGSNERPAEESEGAPTAEPQPPSDLDLEKAENFTISFIESIAEERGRNVEWAAQAVRDSVAVSAEQAVALNVVDLVARDREDLIAQLDGRVVDLDGERVRLALAEAPVRELEMGTLARFLHTIWDPYYALLLLFAGGTLLWIEFTTPGIGVPGILGAACLIVAIVSLQVVPFSWLGLGLFVVGFALFATELALGAYGLLFAAGAVCMLLGGSMLFDRPDASDLNVPFWTTVAPIVGGFGAFAIFVGVSVGRVLRKPSAIGVGELIGMRGVAASALAPSGSVSLRGELWSADADGEIAKGDAVEVTAVEGMRLRVRRATRRAGSKENA
jgi:membrane-bound serine protease (ClpP class)